MSRRPLLLALVLPLVAVAAPMVAEASHCVTIGPVVPAFLPVLPDQRPVRNGDMTLGVPARTLPSTASAALAQLGVEGPVPSAALGFDLATASGALPRSTSALLFQGGGLSLLLDLDPLDRAEGGLRLVQPGGIDPAAPAPWHFRAPGAVFLSYKAMVPEGQPSATVRGSLATDQGPGPHQGEPRTIPADGAWRTCADGFAVVSPPAAGAEEVEVGARLLGLALQADAGLGGGRVYVDDVMLLSAPGTLVFDP
jgi:hypothetical protein